MRLFQLHCASVRFKSPAVGRLRQKTAPGSDGQTRLRAAASVMGKLTDTQNQAYETLCKKLKEMSALEGVAGLLGWDEMVMMPSGAADCRGAQQAALTGVLHDKQSEAELGRLLKDLKGTAGLDPIQAAVVRDAWSDWQRTTAIPKELAQRMSRLETDGYAAWVKAREASDWSQFAPFLEQWVELQREKAQHIDSKAPVYDVLLHDFERGMTSARLDEIFTQVRDGLAPLIAELTSKGSPPSNAILMGSWDVGAQAALCRQVALDIGFNLDMGRLDVSVHPYTSASHPSDVRMTTRYKPDDLSEGLTGAVHETGHALYEQGRNLEYDGLPVNKPASMGIHESQSLLWERMVALGPSFCKYLLPKLKEHFPSFPEATPEELYGAFSVIKVPSFIRVEADEVTYTMHIILRYEIERGLLDGSIKVADVPALWNSKMQQYLGCTPSSDAQGCLQDIHWSRGLFGYFPTYSLGAMYACQIYFKARQEIPGLEDMLAAGNFKPLKEWLNTHIHRVGSLYNNGDELMLAVTGAKLDPAIFLGFLREKYTKLYKLPA